MPGCTSCFSTRGAARTLLCNWIPRSVGHLLQPPQIRTGAWTHARTRTWTQIKLIKRKQDLLRVSLWLVEERPPQGNRLSVIVRTDEEASFMAHCGKWHRVEKKIMTLQNGENEDYEEISEAESKWMQADRSVSKLSGWWPGAPSAIGTNFLRETNATDQGETEKRRRQRACVLLGKILRRRSPKRKWRRFQTQQFQWNE